MALILGREILLKNTSLRLPKGGTEGRQARAVSIVFHEAARRGGYFHRISTLFPLYFNGVSIKKIKPRINTGLLLYFLAM
jgi:hypothetical protein